MFSFKINKKSSSQSNPVQKPSETNSKRAFNDDDDKDEEEPDFIDGLEGTNIVSKKQKKPEKKELLVIPLITKNEWRIDKAEKKLWIPNGDPEAEGDPKQNEERGEDVSSSSTGNETSSLQQQAIKELLEEASTTNSSSKKNNKSIPILFQNRVPDGYEEDDNMDVSLRPEQSNLDDYERIPIEEFGIAMLRGMGWKETEGIGLKNKKVVEMMEPKIRPKGMGLGAEAAHLNKDITPKNAGSNDADKEDLSFRIGGYVIITRGSKKGYYGQIESFDEDNNRVIVRLAISGKMEAVSKFYVNVVPSTEYKKNSKVINSEKYEEYKLKQEDANKNGREEKKVSKRYEDDARSGTDDEREYRSKSSRNEREVKKVSKRHEDDTRSSTDDEREYKSKSSRNGRSEDYQRSDTEKSGNRERERASRKHEKNRDQVKRDDRRDRNYDRKYDDRNRDKRDSNRDDGHYSNSSSKNGDRRSEKHRKDDRDRRRGHSSRD